MTSKILLILNLWLFPQALLADTGCYLTSGPFANRVYYLLQTSASNQFYSGDISYASDCTTDCSGSSSYYILTSDLSSTQCFAQLSPGASPDSTNPGDYSYNGNLVSFDVGNCPLDNVWPILFFALAATGLLWKNYLKLLS